MRVDPSVPEPLETLGERLRAARTEVGMTTTQLAAAVGISTGSYSRIENNHATTSAATLSRIAVVTGVPLEELDGTRPMLPAVQRAYNEGYGAGWDDAAKEYRKPPRTEPVELV